MHAYHEGVEDRLDPCQVSRLSSSCHVASNEKQEHLSTDQGASAHISTAALISTYIKTVFFLSPSPVMRNSCSIRHTCVCLCVCVCACACVRGSTFAHTYMHACPRTRLSPRSHLTPARVFNGVCERESVRACLSEQDNTCACLDVDTYVCLSVNTFVFLRLKRCAYQ